ncbi:hypothetical protein ACGRHY_21930 [Streptomyces sp. HK10]|uniref:hypothetical protein n=1 Tax=Streptomyces sp. HK10 TaxID=3373255 RepID=UPI003748EF03
MSALTAAGPPICAPYSPSAGTPSADEPAGREALHDLVVRVRTDAGRPAQA